MPRPWASLEPSVAAHSQSPDLPAPFFTKQPARVLVSNRFLIFFLAYCHSSISNVSPPPPALLPCAASFLPQPLSPETTLLQLPGGAS